MYNSVIECVKVSNIFIGLKKTCLGVLDRGNREKDNEIGLKEGRSHRKLKTPFIRFFVFTYRCFFAFLL